MQYQFILICLTFLGVLFPLHHAPYESVPIPEEVTFKRKNFYKDNPSELFKLFISYPEAEGNDPEEKHEINLGIQRVMTKAIADFKSEMRNLQNKNAEITYGTLKFDYLVTHLSPKFVSVQFQKDIDFGERYGRKSHVLTFNYNLTAKRSTRVQTIFSPETDFAKEVYALLKAKANGFKPDPKRMFDKISLTESHLVFYFDETNSNQNTINEIRLPWSEVNHLLSEDSDARVF